VLWADLEAPPRRGKPSRASEPMAAYGDASLEDAP
jgi:hypothetical protein